MSKIRKRETTRQLSRKIGKSSRKGKLFKMLRRERMTPRSKINLP